MDLYFGDENIQVQYHRSDSDVIESYSQQSMWPADQILKNDLNVTFSFLPFLPSFPSLPMYPPIHQSLMHHYHTRKTYDALVRDHK